MKNETNVNIEKIINDILEKQPIYSDAVPNIDLYMDQVTSFMEDNLKSNKRYETDKILTKTMINNYVKDNLLPAPHKKKYSKEHLLILIFIYYLKGILSIKDIEQLLSPLAKDYFHNDKGMNVTDVYDTVWKMQPELSASLKKTLEEYHVLAESLSGELPAKENEDFKRFAFIFALAFDVYMKKQMIEKLIDESI